MVVAERAIICRMVHLFFSRQRRGPTGGAGGAAATWAAALLTHHKQFGVLDTRTSVSPFADIVQYFVQCFCGVVFIGLLVGEPEAQ